MTRVPVYMCLDCDAIFGALPAGDPNPECEGACTFVQAWVSADSVEAEGPQTSYPPGEDGPKDVSARSPVGNSGPREVPRGWESFLGRPKGAT